MLWGVYWPIIQLTASYIAPPSFTHMSVIYKTSFKISANVLGWYFLKIKFKEMFKMNERVGACGNLSLRVANVVNMQRKDFNVSAAL